MRPADGGTLAFKLNDGAIAITGDQPSGTVQNGTLYVTDEALLPDADGSFELELTVPADLPASATPQTYWVRLLAGLDGGPAASKFAYFTVAADEEPSDATAQVTRVTTATSGAVTLTLAGTGYTPGSTVSLAYAGQPVSFSGASATATVTAEGTFSGSAVLAAGTALAGDHTITVTGSQDGSVVAEFTTAPAVAITGNPSPNSTIDVTAVNLPEGWSVTGLGAGSNWLSSPVAADGAGKAVLTAVPVPATATVGAAIKLPYTSRGAPVEFDTAKIVTPDDSILNADDYTVTSVAVHNGLYQTAENPATGKLFATTAVGRPPVTDSALLKLDATTLAVEQEATPPVADEATGGLFAVYGIGLDNTLGQVWLTNTRQNTVAVYSQSDLSLLKQFPAGTTEHSRDVIVDEKTHKAYVSSASKTYIDVFDAPTLTYLERINLGTEAKPFPTVMSLDLDRTNGVLFTTSLGSPQAAAIEIRNNNKVTYYDLGSNVASASGVAFDTKRSRIYVVSQATHNLVALPVAR